MLEAKRQQVRLNGILYELVYSREEVLAHHQKLTAAILAAYWKEQNPPNPLRRLVLVPILNGAIYAAVDLSREICRAEPTVPVEVDTSGVTAYGKEKKAGEAKVTKVLSQPVDGKIVVIVEDILETGSTAMRAKELLADGKAQAVWTAFLTDKVGHVRVDNLIVDFSGMPIEGWAVGEGLDDDFLCRPWEGIWRRVAGQ